MNGSVALVTGGASGIGLATVRMLLETGAKVAIADVNEAAINAAIAEHAPQKARLMPITVDLSNHEILSGIVDDVVSRFGRLDCLVNSAAAMGGSYDFFKVDAAAIERAFRLNVTTPMLLMQAFARHVSGRGGSGRIVNVSSGSAFRAQKTRLAYGASKAGLNALTRIAAAQLGELDINVNAVAPGITNTPSGTVAKSDPSVLEAKLSVGPHANFLKRVSEPDDVASMIVFLCSKEARQITGQVIHVSAGNIV